MDKVVFETGYTFAIGTYGNVYGAAMYNVKKFAGQHGYRFDYANHILMVDNFLPVFEIESEIKRNARERG